MKMYSNQNVQVFFHLLRAGLWERDVRLSCFNRINYSEVYQIAEEQTVVGLVTLGIERISDVRVPQEDLLQFLGTSLQIEQQNTSMNLFVSNLIEKMHKASIYALLVKGQGIAQSYERPLWRSAGDIDLLLSHDNYEKAKAFLSPLASSIETENVSVYHLGMTIDQWPVELHGSMQSSYLPQMDKIIVEVQNDLFYGGNVRYWQNGETKVSLPSPDNDVFLIFSHIIKHFFREGIGLRQVCDWCRLLWTCRNELDLSLLESRIRRAELLSEWRTFASYVVIYLGMPKEAMPLYSENRKWKCKAKRVNSFIINVGNFGHNRNISYYAEKSLIARKTISFCRRTADFVEHFFIFPRDSMKVWFHTIVNGTKAVLRQKYGDI